MLSSTFRHTRKARCCTAIAMRSSNLMYSQLKLLSHFMSVPEFNKWSTSESQFHFVKLTADDLVKVIVRVSDNCDDTGRDVDDSLCVSGGHDI